MCFEIWVWADPGAGNASCREQVSVVFKKQTNRTQKKLLLSPTNLILPKDFIWLWLMINLFFPCWIASISFQWCSKIQPFFPSLLKAASSLLTGLPAEKAKLTGFHFLDHTLHTWTWTKLLQGPKGICYPGTEKRMHSGLSVFFLKSGGEVVTSCQAHTSCCKCIES